MRRLWPGALCLAVLASACATWKHPEPPPTAVATAAVTLDDLRRSLDSRRQALRSLRTFARFAYRSPEESHTARQLLLVRRPDRLRSELFSPFGSVFLLVTDGIRLTAYAPRDKTVWTGAASAVNLARYTKLPLEVPTVVDLLLGIPPVDAGPDASLSDDAGRIKLLEVNDDEVEAAWFDRRLEPLRYELRAVDGRVRAAATFAHYAELSGVRIPHEISIEMPPSEQTVEITLSEPEINPDLADALFVFDSPAGSRLVELDHP